MSEKIIKLSGRAADVLYALFFRGALQSGDLPSKSGAAQLRELGFAETRHTATQYQKENYFTFLTAEGQELAVKYLADTCIGVPCVAGSVVVAGKLYSAGIDISNGQRKVVFEADRFKVDEAAQSVIENAVFSSVKMKTLLSDEMEQAIIDAVRESDLFTSLQAASTSGLQQAVNDAVGDAIRNAMRPGGALWVAIPHR